MKSKVILFFFALINSFSIQAIAQKSTSKSSPIVDISWGAKSKTSFHESVRDILLDDGQNIYITSDDTKQVFLSNDQVTPSMVKLDNSLSVVKSNKYSSAEKKIQYHGIYYIGGNFAMITSFYDSKTKLVTYSAQKINTSLETEGEKKILFSVTWNVQYKYKHSIFSSPDSTKICISTFPDQKKTENRVFNYLIFDSNLKTIYEKKISINKHSDLFEIKKMQLSNKNELFVLAKVYGDEGKNEEVKSPEGKIAGYKFSLTKYDIDGNLKELDLDLKHRFSSDLYMESQKNGDVVIFLTYETKHDNGLNGVMYLKYDAATSNLVNLTDYAFTKDFSERIEAMQNDGPGGKIPAINNYFQITDFKKMDDGSAYALIEKNWRMTEGKNERFFSQGLVAIKMDEAGSVKWCNFIPKYQAMTYYPGFLYHSTMYFNNELYILYNDDDDNINYDITSSNKRPDRMTGAKNLNLMMVEFDANGKLSRKKIYTSSDAKLSINTQSTKQSSPTRMTLYGETFNMVGGNHQKNLGIAVFK